MTVRFGSVCSGIEAASVAFAPLGWQAAWLSEIKPFPSALLAHRYPDAPNLGDMTTLPSRIAAGEVEAPDVLCGGTPCQAFSLAGLRESLADARGNLTLVYCEILNEIDKARQAQGLAPAVALWENVHGVLSTADNAFGHFLAGLCGERSALQPPGGKWLDAGAVVGPQRTVAWRTLDAQFFGLAQRRRRVFVVASARDDFDPLSVLFEFDGVRRDSAPSRETRQETPAGALRGTQGGSDVDHARAGHLIAATLDASYHRLQGCAGQDMNHGHSHLVVQAFGGNDTSGPIPVAACLNANRGCHNPGDFEAGTLLVLPFDTTQVTSPSNVSAPVWGDPCHPLAAGAHPPTVVAFPAFLSGTQAASTEDLSPALCALNPTAVATAFQERGRGAGQKSLDVHGDLAYALLSITGGSRSNEMNVAYTTGFNTAVRRLMPVECERLQGFEDGYTKIPNWSGWRLLSADETPEGCKAQGLEVRQSASGRWRVNDADGPRYEALGNSWAVPCARWIGRRIDAQLQQCVML